MSDTGQTPTEPVDLVEEDQRQETPEVVTDPKSTAVKPILMGGLAGMVGGALIAGVVLIAGASKQPPLAVMDLNEVMEIEQTRLTLMVSKKGTTDEERMKAYTKVKAFGEELSKAIREVQAECKCTLLNRSAYIGEVPRDYTPELKAKLGMEGIDLEELRLLTAESMRSTLPSVDLSTAIRKKQ
jgi:hypothetical protein